jgi:hypothetical protein
MRDCARAYKMGRGDLHDYTVKEVDKYRSGFESFLAFTGSAVRGDIHTKHSRIESSLEDTDLFARFVACYRECIDQKTLIGRPGVIAAFISTGDCRRRDVHEKFWMELSTGLWATSDKNHPPKRAHDWLRRTTTVGGARTVVTDGIRDSGGRHTSWDIYVYCVRCWNRWVDGEPVGLVKCCTNADNLEVAIPDSIGWME